MRQPKNVFAAEPMNDTLNGAEFDALYMSFTCAKCICQMLYALR